MKNQRNKKIHIISIVLLLLVAIALAYPSAKKLRSMTKTFTRPAQLGKEIIYSYIEKGEIRVADLALDDIYEISRFEPIKIENISWQEDPYDDIFWRFNFYNLEPVRNLLFAWQETEDNKYKDKLIVITESFLDNGIDGPHSWDLHGTAFRTMTLINVRQKLLDKKQLPEALDSKIQKALKIHGDFLTDPAHFEKDYNHGLDQAAALYLLAINYPGLPRADDWLKTSSVRMRTVLFGIIDEDGLLVENSPYYHLYVLEKFYEINKYLNQHNLEIEGFSDENINKMISYVVYMLQPDLSVPTVGASITRNVGLSGVYKEMAADHPDLLYVLTKGSYGEKPTATNVHYPIAGQTIMRSGWEKGDDFSTQTQLIFDVGNYRTNHSDLDALSFNLFGKGTTLMPDAGLYTYKPGPYRSYFHGTSSHNTVVVDGKDQSQGNTSSKNKVTAGFFKQGDGYVYQSGQSTLYEGVVHKRAIMLIEDSTVLVFDDLQSDSEHTYEQMFHLFPGAKVTTDGLNVSALSDDPEKSLAIKQYVNEGLELKSSIGKKDPPAGLCSIEYNTAIPCRSISYSKKGNNVSFVTTISIGKKADIIFDEKKKSLSIVTSKGSYTINSSETEDRERLIEAKKSDLSEIYSNAQPFDSLNDLSGWQQSEYSGAYGGSLALNSKENSMRIIAPSDGSNFEVTKKIDVDLSNQNIYFKIMVEDASAFEGFDMYLSNNNWENEIAFYVSGSTYDVDRSGEWLHFGIGKSETRNSELGGWFMYNRSFDWSKVDALQFTAQSHEGKNAAINIKDFNLVPDQKEGRVVIVFDDGWSSVMDAAQIMKEHNFKGNVGVIAESVGKKQFLTLNELKTLQNDYHWNIANHSSFHKNSVEEYSSKNDLEGLETDVTDALQFLIQNDINSAPNWYIYPSGETDGSVKDVVGKYYTFGRATNNIPEVFPFSDPLEVGIFSVYTNRAEPVDIRNAVKDAIKYDHTLFLMFHKFSKGEPEVYTEMSLSAFDEILSDIKSQGIKVVTLSELDEENGVPQTQFTLNDAQPSQINLDVSSTYNSNMLIRAILN